MAEYRVKWEIDIDADSPEEAARLAREKQLDSNSWATVFDVWQTHIGEHEAERFDLTELDNERLALLQQERDHYAAHKAARAAGRLKVIHLEDNGQDFLRFVIDSDNVIVRTEPFQGWMWDGRKLDHIIVGASPLISDKIVPDGWLRLGYRVEAITNDQSSDA